MDTSQIRQCRLTSSGWYIEPHPQALCRQNARLFYQNCLQQLQAPARVIINLGTLEQIDSQGLGALLALDEYFQDFGGIRLIAGKDSWLTLLDIMRMQHLQLAE